MTHSHADLLGGPPPTLLPDDPATALLAAGQDPATVAAAHPTSSAAWAALAARSLDAPGPAAAVEAYAYARTGYHRGLDALRRNGWKGFGPVPWSHAPNQGVLRCFSLLAAAAERIGEQVEVERLTALLDESDPAAAASARESLT